MKYKSLIKKDALIHCTIDRPRTRFSRHNFANGTNYRLRIVRYYGLLKHTSTLFSLSDHDILSRELLLIKYRPIIVVGLCAIISVTELLIMRDPHYDRMCFKSVKTLGALHS